MSGFKPEQLGEKELMVEPGQGFFCKSAAFEDIFNRWFPVWL